MIWPVPLVGRRAGRGMSRTVAVLLGLLLATVAPAVRADDAGLAAYEGQIRPLLKERCYACHGALKSQAGLRLDTVAAMLEGGDSGPAIEPGDSEFSPLVERIIEHDEALRMPPEGEPLTDDQVAIIRSWIDSGAAAPSDEAPEPDPRDHWAFQTPTRPEVPDAGAGWVRVVLRGEGAPT